MNKKLADFHKKSSSFAFRMKMSLPNQNM